MANKLLFSIVILSLVSCGGGSGGVPSIPEEPKNIISLSSFNDGSCAVQANNTNDSGNLLCWGGVVTRFGGLETDDPNYIATPKIISHPKSIRSVALGSEHLCVINAQHELWCMGDDTLGGVGVASSSSEFRPTQLYQQLTMIDPGTDWESVNSGVSNSCAIKIGGLLYCWGNNDNRQLATATAQVLVKKPSLIFESSTAQGQSHWSKVSVDKAHTCGVQTDGSLWCWGKSSLGRLGRAETTPMNNPFPLKITNPVAVADLKWLDITTGTAHSCGIVESSADATSGFIYCWGSNKVGQVGQTNLTAADKIINAPKKLSLGDSWVKVSASGDTTCAINEVKEMYCWGAEANVQPGSSANQDVYIPTLVGNGNDKNWINVSTSVRHRCAVKTVLNSENKSASDVWCWGNNGVAQLGNGIPGVSTTPTEVFPGTGQIWTTVTAGAQHACGDKGQNTFCWGNNNAGQLGTGNKNKAYTPVKLITKVDRGWGNYDNFWSHGCGINYSFATTTAVPSIFCWGNSAGYKTTATFDVAKQSTPSKIAFTQRDWERTTVGRFHSCVSDKLDNLFCWGKNTAGQVGKVVDAANLNVLTATKINIPGSTNSKWRLYDSGYETMCGRLRSQDANSVSLVEDHTLWCWGNTNNWQFMDPAKARKNINKEAYSEKLTKVVHPSGQEWFALSIGQDHICGITRNTDELFCWGNNINGALGLDTSDTTKYPDGIVKFNAMEAINTPADSESGIKSAWRLVSTHQRNTCALKRDNTLWCWGANDEGAIGNGTISITPSITPTQVLTSTAGWNWVSVGSRFACAIDLEQKLMCWGINSIGQLGNGKTFTTIPTKTTM